MLELKDITKDYDAGGNAVHALKGISVTFRKSEFVSVLGASGCGKTTLLNIIGGLDRYTGGDLVINGVSTKKYKDSDWDSYRNHSIGFVFQSYNLIPHLTVLGNVEIALTLSGVSREERLKRAEEALNKVGLSDQLKKRPNQLSGGQMQRVAIARAIVNNPDIILADEPTGALDSKTSVQIMELLKEISAGRLVIMVTHNNELAEKYSTRIIRLADGEKEGDTNPYGEYTHRCDELIEKGAKKKKSAMSFFTALNLSFKNLLTKKGRTFMTSFAGSIGIIGIALVLALSNGFNSYIDRMQSETLGKYPISIETSGIDYESMMSEQNSKYEGEEYPYESGIVAYEPNTSIVTNNNDITADYVDYVQKLDSSLYSDIQYSYGLYINSFINVNGEIKSFASDLDTYYNDTFMQSIYDVIAGEYPTAANEGVLIVDKYNRLSVDILESLGIEAADGDEIDFDIVKNLNIKVFDNDDVYTESNGIYTKTTPSLAGFTDKGESLKITALLRVKPEASMDMLGSGYFFSNGLLTSLVENASKSKVGKAQKEAAESAGSAENTVSVTAGLTFKEIYEAQKAQLQNNPAAILTLANAKQLYINAMRGLGADKTPTGIYILPINFVKKDAIKEYLDKWNEDKTDAEKINYSDVASLLTGVMKNMVNIISYVLIAFSAISLVVSGIMIGIITYVSVIERTKEIGILRSVGARKKDISRVFNAETLLIGFCAGAIGMIIAFVLTFPINIIITAVAEMPVGNMAVVSPLNVVTLVLISMALTLVAGLIPSGVAARKDPVTALRSE